MSDLSDYAENKLLDHLTGTSAFTMPTAVYVAAFTDDPGEDASGTEVSGNAYARVDTDYDAASGGATNPDADVEFPEATGSWGTVSHVALFDAATNGNMLMYGALSASKAIGDGDTLRIPAADLDLALQ